MDIITSPETHRDMVALAAKHGVPVICQKPLANDLETAQEMVAICHDAHVPLLVHENWRWQRPLRELKKALDSGAIGKPFRAHIDFSSSFPVFDNQPFLRELDKFILSDMGVHILDVVRFLFGEAEWLMCRIQRVNPTIRGEDVATVLLQMGVDDGHLHPELCQPIGTRRFPEHLSSLRESKDRSSLLPIFGFG